LVNIQVKLKKIKWCQKQQIKVKNIEDILLDLSVLEYLKLCLSPIWNLMNNLGWINSSYFIELASKQQALQTKDLEVFRLILWISPVNRV